MKGAALCVQVRRAVFAEGMSRREAAGSIGADNMSVTLGLLRNISMQIRESAPDDIVDHARAVEELHAPLAMRPEPTDRLVGKLSKFVSSSLIFDLSVRSGLSDEICLVLKKRIAESDEAPPNEMPSEEDIVNATRRHAEDEVITGLAMRAGITEDAVQRVFLWDCPRRSWRWRGSRSSRWPQPAHCRPSPAG